MGLIDLLRRIKKKTLLKSILQAYLLTFIPSIIFGLIYVIYFYEESETIIFKGLFVIALVIVWPLSISDFWVDLETFLWMITSFPFFFFFTKIRYKKNFEKLFKYQNEFEDELSYFLKIFDLIKDIITTNVDNLRDHLHFINKSANSSITNAEALEVRKSFGKLNEMTSKLSSKIRDLENLETSVNVMFNTVDPKQVIIDNVDKIIMSKINPQIITNYKSDILEKQLFYQELTDQTYGNIENKIKLTSLFERFSPILSEARPGVEIPIERIAKIMNMSKESTIEFLTYINSEYPNLGKFILIEDLFILSKDSIKSSIDMNAHPKPFDNNLLKVIEVRRCCTLHARLGDSYCNICGRVIPDNFI